jgi:hypothetical protein
VGVVRADKDVSLGKENLGVDTFWEAMVTSELCRWMTLPLSFS